MKSDCPPLTGTIHASSGPVPGGYYMVVYLDNQEPWPYAFQDGKRVTVILQEKK